MACTSAQTQMRECTRVLPSCPLPSYHLQLVSEYWDTRDHPMLSPPLVQPVVSVSRILSILGYQGSYLVVPSPPTTCSQCVQNTRDPSKLSPPLPSLPHVVNVSRMLSIPGYQGYYQVVSSPPYHPQSMVHNTQYPGILPSCPLPSLPPSWCPEYMYPGILGILLQVFWTQVVGRRGDDVGGSLLLGDTKGQFTI